MAVYKPYFVVYAPFSETAGTADSPIEKFFRDTANPKFGSVADYTRFDAPKELIAIDTRIGKCGSRDCATKPEDVVVLPGSKTCNAGTHKVKPLTPDYEIFRRVYEDWNARGKNGGVLIVKTTTVTGVPSANVLADALASAEEEFASIGGLDIFYFAKWLDRIDQYVVLKELAAGAKMIRTWNPNGMQSVAISPSGMEKLSKFYNPATNPVVTRPFSQVLNAIVQKGTLVAGSTTPTLMSFDATLVSVRRTHGAPEAPFSYLKTCEGRGDVLPERPLNRRISGDLGLFWFVIVVMVSTITVAVMLKLGAMVI